MGTIGDGYSRDRAAGGTLGQIPADELLRLSSESPNGSSAHRQFGGRGGVRRWAEEIWAISGLSEAEIQAAADRHPGLTAKYSLSPNGGEKSACTRATRSAIGADLSRL